MYSVVLTNMCMIQDKDNGCVLLQDRTSNNWPGLTFPGGHLDPGESLVESTLREVKEETGLTVSDLTFCGVVGWHNDAIKEKDIVSLFRTQNFHGSLLESPREGNLLWFPEQKLKQVAGILPANSLEHTVLLSPDFDNILRVYYNDYIEGYTRTQNGETWEEFKFF